MHDYIGRTCRIELQILHLKYQEHIEGKNKEKNYKPFIDSKHSIAKKLDFSFFTNKNAFRI